MKPIYESFRQSFNRDIYKLGSNVIAAPTATVYAEKGFTSTVKLASPQTVFFRINKHLDVLDADGKPFATLYDCLACDKSFIPVFCVEDEQTVQALSEFVYFNALADAAVCVKYQKRRLLQLSQLISPWLRGMVDLRDLSADEDWLRIAGDVWTVRALSVVLSEAQTKRKTVDLLHERLLSVWGESCDGISAALKGVDGAIVDTSKLLDFYTFLSSLPENTLLDNYRVIAHKGFQDGYTEPENSITAIKKGADYHLDGAEIDIKLSTDGIPFIIHNPTTRGILKGEVKPVEALSSDELDSRERSDFPGEYTDRLEKMLEVLKPYESYPIFLEFKPTAKLYHVEKMTHAIKGIIDRTGTEYNSIALCVPQRMQYVQRLLPRLPKCSGVTETGDLPTSYAEASELLYKHLSQTVYSPAAFCIEDVSVNRFFGEVAAIRGLFTVVWTRSHYFKHSLWENDGERSDEGFVSGFYATISDHAERYFHLPTALKVIDGTPYAVMRDGTRAVADGAQLLELPNGKKVYTLELTLPHGIRINIVSEEF